MIKGSFHEHEEVFAVFSSVFRHSETSEEITLFID